MQSEKVLRTIVCVPDAVWATFNYMFCDDPHYLKHAGGCVFLVVFNPTADQKSLKKMVNPASGQPRQAKFFDAIRNIMNRDEIGKGLAGAVKGPAVIQ